MSLLYVYRVSSNASKFIKRPAALQQTLSFEMKTPEKKVLKDLYFIKSFLFSHFSAKARKMPKKQYILDRLQDLAVMKTNLLNDLVRTFFKEQKMSSNDFTQTNLTRIK